MPIIKQLSFRNWMNIVEADLTIQEDISAFIGKNGQGKSAVFAGVGYMLADYRRGESWKDYVRSGEDSFDLKMVLSMSTNPRDLMYFDFSGDITTSVTHKQVSYRGKTYINSDANDFISKTFDSDMVRNVLLTLQDTKAISALTPSEGREIFKKVFNSDFSDVSEKIKNDSDAHKITESNLKNSIMVIQNKTYTFRDETPADDSQLPVLKQELLNAQNSQLELDKYNFYLQKVNSLDTIRKEISSLGADIQKKNASIEADNEKIKASSGFTDKTLQSLDLAKQDLVKSSEETKELEQQVTHANTLKTGEELKLGAIEIQLGAKQKVVNELTSQVKVIERHLKAHEEGFCTNCGQKTDADNKGKLEEELATVKSNLSDVENQIAELNQDKEKVNLTIRAKQVEIRNLEAKVNESKTQSIRIQHSIESLEQKLNSIESEKSIFAGSILRAKEDIETINSKIKVKQEFLEKEEKWCTENAMTKPTINTRPVVSIQKDIDTIISQVQAVELNKQYNQQLVVQQEQDKKEVEEINKKLNDVQLTIKNLTAVKKIFDSEFPNYINLRACSLLEGFINSFFESVKPNFKINIVLEKKGVIMRYKAKDEPNWLPVSMVSGFESALLSIAFRVAVAQAFGSEILILDEPDGPADLDNSEALFQQISNIKGFRQIFVISHKPNAIDLLKESGATIWKVSQGQFEQLET